MGNEEQIAALAQAYRDLRALPDAAAARVLPTSYAEAWRRADARIEALARGLTPGQRQEAYERSQFGG